MKKTLLALLLVLTLCLPFFVGCDTTEPEVTEKPSGGAAENDTAGETSGVGSVDSSGETQNYDEMFNDPYEVYVALTERGYTGTFEEWVASLAGKDGAPGRGIESIEIVKGEFVVTYTDGTVVNLGALAENEGTEGTEGLEYYPLPDGTFGVKMGTTKYLEEVVIPETYKGAAVTLILDEAFKKATNLKSITIPDSVTSIGVDAFSGCSSLTSVVIPDSVTSIGASAFYNCTSLTSVEIGDSVTSIGNSAFYHCASLTSVEIGDSVTSIGDSAFYYCFSLTSVVIPDSVTSISNYAFRACTSLTSVVIPDSVTSIGDSAFYGCSSLTSVVIPDSVTDIGIMRSKNAPA